MCALFIRSVFHHNHNRTLAAYIDTVDVADWRWQRLLASFLLGLMNISQADAPSKRL